MKSSQLLIKSIRELSRSVDLLESRMNNLSHPGIETLVKYQESLNNIGQLSGKSQTKKKSELIQGKMTDRLKEMNKTIETLEAMFLEASRGIGND